MSLMHLIAAVSGCVLLLGHNVLCFNHFIRILPMNHHLITVIKANEKYRPLRDHIAPLTHASSGSNESSINEKLTSLGQSGMLAYGFLNFSYYTFTLLLAWFGIQDKYRQNFHMLSFKQRYIITTSRFVKLVAVVWAGSQVTKPFRISGSIFMSPYVDKFIDFIQKKFGLSSRNKTFGILASAFLFSTIAVYALLIILNVLL